MQSDANLGLLLDRELAVLLDDALYLGCPCSPCTLRPFTSAALRGCSFICADACLADSVALASSHSSASHASR